VTGVFQRPAARRDLIEHYVYLAENAAETLADRFLTRAQESFSQDPRQPLMSSPVASRRRALAGLRKWRVADFEDILIFWFVCRQNLWVKLLALAECSLHTRVCQGARPGFAHTGEDLEARGVSAGVAVQAIQNSANAPRRTCVRFHRRLLLAKEVYRLRLPHHPGLVVPQGGPRSCGWEAA
jgi:toxin ParE1/3/4